MFIEREYMYISTDTYWVGTPSNPVYELEFNEKERYYGCRNKDLVYIKTMMYMSKIYKVIYTNSFKCNEVLKQ